MNLHRNNAAEWVMWAIYRPVQWFVKISLHLAGPLAGRSFDLPLTARERAG